MDHGASSYRRFLAGDDEGIVEIVRDHRDGLMLFINRYVNNIHVAEELTEDTFFRLVTKRPPFTARGSFKTWLYTMGRNAAINYMKRSQRRSAMSMEELAEVLADETELERSYLLHEQKLELHRALSRIPTQYATVLHLKYFEDMRNEQIAGVMKRSKRQIENLLYQAKQALKTELNTEGFIDEKS